MLVEMQPKGNYEGAIRVNDVHFNYERRAMKTKHFLDKKKGGNELNYNYKDKIIFTERMKIR